MHRTPARAGNSRAVQLIAVSTAKDTETTEKMIMVAGSRSKRPEPQETKSKLVRYVTMETA